MTARLHFDKVFQIPLVLAHELAGVRYRDLLEAFSEGDLRDFPRSAHPRLLPRHGPRHPGRRRGILPVGAVAEHLLAGR